MANFADAGFSMMPPHHRCPGPGIATHTRFTRAATPYAGTLRRKWGGSTDGDAPAISRRTPSVLTSTIFDATPSTDASNRGTSIRGDRRAGRPSASPNATDNSSVSFVTGRSIHVASRGTSSICSPRAPTRISGRLWPSSLTIRGRSAAETSRTSAINASIGLVAMSAASDSMLTIETGS